jgi:hypothetical protein
MSYARAFAPTLEDDHAPRRHGGDLAARGTRTARRPDAAHRCADALPPRTQGQLRATTFRQGFEKLGWAVSRIENA